MKIIQKYGLIIYILIPILSVFLCRWFRIAQGEKNEEIVFGIMLGVVLDLVLCIVSGGIAGMRSKRD